MDDSDSVLRDIPLSISQVESITGINKPTLRYWERNFSTYLAPKRSDGNQRSYSMDEVQKILQIKKLLKTDGYTIQGAKKKLGLYKEKAE
jgi:DNA-binding transcriptional MerR regulator